MMNVRKKIHTWFFSPLGLFLFFILVNLLPNIGLVCTEPYDFWGKFVLMLFPIGLYASLFSLLRNPSWMQLILIPLLVLHAFQIVVFYLFGEGVIASDMFLNVLTTNVTEAGEVLDAVWVSVVFVIVVYLPTIVIAFIGRKKRFSLSLKFRRNAFLTGLACMLLSVLIELNAKEKNTGNYIFIEEVYPLNVFNNLRIAANKWSLQRDYLSVSSTFDYQAVRRDTTDHRKIYVLVIGETSRADNWGIYGYERNTSPYMNEETGLIVYEDAVTQSNTTHKSVSVMLTAASAENREDVYHQKSILSAFKQTGFTTIFLSNQSANHSFTDFYAQEADFKHYYRFFNRSVNHYDEEMLPAFQHYIDSVPGDLFVILHTYGSHFNYKERYPDSFSVFKPDAVTNVKKESKELMVNAYDNTILYTDHFLHQTIEVLRQSDACAFLLYASDHGEDLLDDGRNRFLHASPSPTYYQLRIPFFLWMSSLYEQSYSETTRAAFENRKTAITTNTIFHTLLDMAHIETPYLNRERSLASRDLKQTVRMYLDDHDRAVPFFRSGLKKEDKEKLIEKGIEHNY